MRSILVIIAELIQHEQRSDDEIHADLLAAAIAPYSIECLQDMDILETR